MEDEDLALPLSIKQKLHLDRVFIPSNYQKFVDFGKEPYLNFLSYGGNQFDYREGWFQ
jgi:hypothetical protein